MVYLKFCLIYFTIIVELINFEQIRALHMQIRSLVIKIKILCDQITVQQLKVHEYAGFQSD